jgi:hydroxypyruvate isomerase
MTRREALAAAVAVPAAAAAVAAEDRFLKQSACGWCFTARGEKWTLPQLCTVAGELKIPSIELVGADELKTLAEHKLTCAILSSGTGFQKGFNNLKLRDEVTAKTVKAIAAAAEFHIPSVIAFVGMEWHDPMDPKSGSISKDDAFKNCVEGLKPIAAAAEKAGVTVCVEHLNSRDGSDPMTGHPGYQGDDLDWVCKILTAVGSPRIKLLFDVYHVQIMHGDLIARIRQYKHLIGHVHTAGVPGRHELDAAQEIHYPPVMKALADSGYRGYVGHEFLPTRDPKAGLREAVAACNY